MEVSAADIDSLRPVQRRALLRTILERKIQETQTYPMSFAQESLWLLNQLYPESAAYHLPAAFLLRGSLDIGALERAFDEIVRRHHVLRTTFAYKAGRPLQRVMPLPQFEFTVRGRNAFSKSEREAAILELIKKNAGRPFDLAAGPLLRVTVMRVSDDEHVLLITLHHIVADAWSIGLLVKELVILYDAFVAGEPHSLAKLALTYGEYALWQRERLGRRRLDELLGYWTRRLAGVENTAGWPADHPRPARPTFNGAEAQRIIEPATLQSFKSLCLEHGVTLFMGLLAAFQALQSCYSLEERIITGAPVANRTLEGTESLIGLFVNVLPFDTDLSGDPDFRAILKRVRDAAIGVYQNQDLPFERLVKALGVRRDLNRNPLFQTVLALQNAPIEKFLLAGLSIERLPVEKTAVPFDLVLHIWELRGGLNCRLEYSKDLFEDSTANKLLGHFHALLSGVVSMPNITLSRLPVLLTAGR